MTLQKNGNRLFFSGRLQPLADIRMKSSCLAVMGGIGLAMVLPPSCQGGAGRAPGGAPSLAYDYATCLSAYLSVLPVYLSVHLTIYLPVYPDGPIFLY